ncbi:MAG: hypothetical protein EOM28_09105 [Clostridia bacterium]|nr:hypothetical protein [Clostridia bacterium]
MKYQKRQDFKKKALAVIALIMAVAMVLSLLAPFTIFAAPMTQAATTVTAKNEEQNLGDTSLNDLKSFGKDLFSVEIQAGFDGNYIVKKAMPVRGVITNHGAAFHGEVQIKAYTRGVNSDKEYAIYYQKLDLEQGASKAIDMEISMGNIHKYFEISLVDTNGTKVYKDNISLTAKVPKTVMIGVLSESTQDLKYLSNLHLAQISEDEMEDSEGYGSESNKNFDFTIFLDEKTFPNSIGIMNSFSVFVVDDFDCSVLSKQQRDVLHRWILEGGTLVVGTGAAAQKTLKGLDFLENIEVKGITTVSEVQGITGEIPLAQFSGEGLTDLKLANEDQVFSVVETGKGHVVISHFSLSASPMAGKDAVLNMLQEALRQAAAQSFAVNLYEDDMNYDNLRYIAEDFPPFEMSSIYLIIGAIAVYIVIAGPLLYLFLKKKEKGEKGWMIVPALSFVFMGMVFLLAQSSTYKNGMINTIGYVEMQQGSSIAKADIGVAIKSSGKGEVAFTSDEKIPVDVNMDEYYHNGVIQKERCAYRILCGDATEITFSDSQSWGTQYFKTQSSMDLGGAIESTVVMKDGKFTGEIINHTNVDFYHVVLMLDGYLSEFDALGAGETLAVDINIEDLTKEQQVIYSGYNYEEIREQVNSGEMSRNEAYLRMMEQDLQQQYYNYQESTDLIPVTFFGYSDASILSGEKKVNGKQVLENNIVMYQQNFPLELSKQEEFQIELTGTIDAQMKFDQYRDDFGDRVHPFEDGDFYISYTMPEGVRIDSLKIRVGVMDEFVPDALKLFNRKTQEWDEVSLDEPINAQDYVDESNLVEIKMGCMQDIETQVPELLIQGGGLFAGN